MKKENIKKAVAEAKRFIACAKALEEETVKSYTNVEYTFYNSGTKESGALRRASMDLTRSLAEMRKP
jgi:hypothetical protein